MIMRNGFLIATIYQLTQLISPLVAAASFNWRGSGLKLLLTKIIIELSSSDYISSYICFFNRFRVRVAKLSSVFK